MADTMYCSSCGNTLSEGLVFCNKCGKRVKDSSVVDRGGLSEASTNFLIAALLGIPIAGIGVLIGLVSVLKKELDFPNDVVVIITFMAFALLLAAEFSFLFLLISSRRAAAKAAAAEEKRQLNSAQNRVLPEANMQNVVTPAGSVTENTTRSFDPVYRETK